MHRLRYFISWLAITLSTLSIIFLFFLLIFLIRDFENPGGIYFYIYFIFIPLWFILSFLFTLIGSFIVSRKKGMKRIIQTIAINIVTGIGFFALIFLVLQWNSAYVQQKRTQKIQTTKNNTEIKNIEWLKIDTDNDTLFDHLLVRYTIDTAVDIGIIHTFVAVTLDRSFSPYVLANDDAIYNRTQEITKGSWLCELLLTKTISEERLNNLIAVQKLITITIREETHTLRSPAELIKRTTPITLDLGTFNTTDKFAEYIGGDSTRKKNICFKKQ